MYTIERSPSGTTTYIRIGLWLQNGAVHLRAPVREGTEVSYVPKGSKLDKLFRKIIKMPKRFKANTKGIRHPVYRRV